jgi:molecular chaperone GrpE
LNNLPEEAPVNINVDALKQKEAAAKKTAPADEAATEQPKEQQIEETKNMLLRALADLDNYKKLAQKEKEEILKFSHTTIIAELLPVIDGLERAIEATQKHDTVEHVQQGIELVLKQFKTALQKHGVEEIDALGQAYNPELHEAISTQETKDKSNQVVAQLHKGYKLNGRLVRPAAVIISKNK